MSRFLMVLLTLLVASCSEDDAVFAVDPSSSYWQTACIKLEEDLVACYGPGWSAGVKRQKEIYDFYKVSVEKKGLDSGSTVIHQRSFDVSEVKPTVLDRFSTDVVEMVPGSGIVRFHITDPPYEYEL